MHASIQMSAYATEGLAGVATMAAVRPEPTIASLTADPERRCLVLDTGVSQRWRYGAVAPGAAAAEEASAWELAKNAAGGLHFLVIQEDDEADVAGLWLLLDRPAPNV